MTASCTGGLGDIVYSIPVMRKLNIYTYLIPNEPIFTPIYRLLRSQEIKCFPYTHENALNIDNFRNQRQRGSKHIIQSMAAEFDVELQDWSKPWLSNIKPVKSFQNLIHVTARWRERSFVKWDKIVPRLSSCAFIGLPEEYEAFCIESKREIPYLETPDILAMAELIAGCDALYCNQSVGLAIAQGLGKKYFLERKPNKQNCLMFTKNENILK
jgi:hypothetical protein